MRNFKKVICVLLLLLIAGCSNTPPDITVSELTAPISPIMRGVVSVFMRIENKGGRDNIINAFTDVPDTIVELHDMKDGKMVKVKSIRIPSNDKVEMIPGGLHVMIFNLPKDIAPGYEFTLNLDFEKSGRKSVTVKTLK